MAMSLNSLLAQYRRAGNWLLPVLRRQRELARLPVAHIGPCDVHFSLGGGEYLAYFGIAPRRETLRQRAIRLAIGVAAGPFGAVLTLQPDAAAGQDTSLGSDIPTLNNGIWDMLSLVANGTIQYHSLIRFSLASIPANAICTSAILTLCTYDYASGSSRLPCDWHSVSAANGDWIEGTKVNALAGAGEPCWDAKKADGSGGVTTAWAGSAGCSTPETDYEAELLGSFTYNTSEVDGTLHDIPLLASRVQQWFGSDTLNYGMVGSPSTTDWLYSDMYSSDAATAAYRPKLVVNYTLPAGGGAMRSPFGSPFTGAF